VGDRSSGSREAEDEGGEGFYIAQSGRCPDLLVIWGSGELLINFSAHLTSKSALSATCDCLGVCCCDIWEFL
jgi:hypothetical protein